MIEKFNYNKKIVKKTTINILFFLFCMNLISGCSAFRSFANWVDGVGKHIPVYDKRCEDRLFCFDNKETSNSDVIENKKRPDAKYNFNQKEVQNDNINPQSEEFLDKKPGSLEERHPDSEIDNLQRDLGW